MASISKADIERMHEMRDAGAPLAEIAQEFGITVASARLLPLRVPPRGVVSENAQKRFDALFAGIVAYKHANDGVAPSYREMAEMIGYASTCSVRWALWRLVAQGRIEMEKGARNIRVVGATWVPPN